MNIKRIVLFTLALYGIGAFSVITIGFLFGDPTPGVDPAQSLLELNSAAQNSIANRTNEKVDTLTKTEPEKKSPEKVSTPKEISTSPTTSTSKSTPSTSTIPTTSTPSPEPDPTPTPTPSCGSGGSCTTAEVAAHNSQSDCWVMLGSKAYNVTSYVNSHPGGSRAFDSSTCGKDITAQMQGTAGSASLSKTKNHSQKAYNILNSYFVANVSG